MKQSIIRGIVLCTLAFSLLIMGTASIGTANSGVAVCHDGPHNVGIVK